MDTDSLNINIDTNIEKRKEGEREEREKKEVEIEIPGLIVVYKDGSIHRVGSFAPTLPACPNQAQKDVFLKPPQQTEKGGTGLWARLFLPQPLPSIKVPVVLYFHGGGMCLGSPSDAPFHLFCSRMASLSQSLWISFAYRLAPEHRLPAAFEDGDCALAWLRSQASSIASATQNNNHHHNSIVPPNIDPWLAQYADFNLVFVAGESAGSNIAHSVVVNAVRAKVSPSLPSLLDDHSVAISSSPSPLEASSVVISSSPSSPSLLHDHFNVVVPSSPSPLKAHSVLVSSSSSLSSPHGVHPIVVSPLSSPLRAHSFVVPPLPSTLGAYSVSVNATSTSPSSPSLLEIVGLICIHPGFFKETSVRAMNASSVVGSERRQLTEDGLQLFLKLCLPLGESPGHPLLNPFHPDSPSLSELSLPPILVTLTSHDVLYDIGAEYFEHLLRCGAQAELFVTKGETHCFHLQASPDTQSVRDLEAKVADFIHKHARRLGFSAMKPS